MEPDTYRVLQISDWHIDLYYTVGAVKEDCSSIICCDASNGMAESLDKGARRYGELSNCDLPMESAEKQLSWLRDNLKNSKKPDIILWTGDSISH